ncbi:hypothetical protein ACJX0J_016354, partial [Zea mays]
IYVALSNNATKLGMENEHWIIIYFILFGLLFNFEYRTDIEKESILSPKTVRKNISIEDKNSRLVPKESITDKN